MSQQEIQSGWESFISIVTVILPLMIVSGLVSICNFFQRHWRTEPFVLSKLIIGVTTDVVYGSLVGCAALGSGRSRFLAWALAGAAVNYGLRRLEALVRKELYQKYGIDERRSCDSGLDKQD